jgi:hypothetical protein
VWFGTDFTLKSRAKADINAEIFQEYVVTVFLPNLNELPSLGQFAEEEAILLMDNVLGHVSEVTRGFSVMRRSV